ncbi:uncharacterized protein LOC119089770 [Pollicipes pollicipes]|uniref:uncharacterized protein LOC119089770 n=1 Tax=Pollicipes pollicipes TaxID=41117 RepID=UPI001884FDF0|nr:uncharacterized protein LOC119089770 [Pollicipes pollicipes]
MATRWRTMASDVLWCALAVWVSVALSGRVQAEVSGAAAAEGTAAAAEGTAAAGEVTAEVTATVIAAVGCIEDTHAETKTSPGQPCRCQHDCSLKQNLHCIDGVCVCTSDSIMVNQTCLPRQHWQQPCTSSAQCVDPHQSCYRADCTDLQRPCLEPPLLCGCRAGYRPPAQRSQDPAFTCRPQQNDVGVLGSHCDTVADCNWQIRHVTCYEGVCRCQSPYSNEVGDTLCAEPVGAWNTAITASAIVVIVAALALLTVWIFKTCSRSREHRVRRVFDISGADLRDQLPPYVAVVSSKTSPRSSAAPSALSCADNAGFVTCELNAVAVKGGAKAGPAPRSSWRAGGARHPAASAVGPDRHT